MLDVVRMAARLDQARALGIGADDHVRHSHARRQIRDERGFSRFADPLRDGQRRREPGLIVQRGWGCHVLRELADRVRVEKPPRESVTEEAQESQMLALRRLPIRERSRLHGHYLIG